MNRKSICYWISDTISNNKLRVHCARQYQVTHIFWIPFRTKCNALVFQICLRIGGKINEALRNKIQHDVTLCTYNEKTLRTSYWVVFFSSSLVLAFLVDIGWNNEYEITIGSNTWHLSLFFFSQSLVFYIRMYFVGLALCRLFCVKANGSVHVWTWIQPNLWMTKLNNVTLYFERIKEEKRREEKRKNCDFSFFFLKLLNENFT